MECGGGGRAKRDLVLIVVIFLQTSLSWEQGTRQSDRLLSQRLRQLDSQFRKFQERTLDHLQSIADTFNVSQSIDTRFKTLTRQYEGLARDLKLFKAATDADLDSLKDWTQKLQKKTKRLDLRMGTLEKSLRENSRVTQRQAQQQREDLSKLSDELQEHVGHIDSVKAHQEEVRDGIRSLQGLLRQQQSQMERLEEHMRERPAAPPPPVSVQTSAGLSPALGLDPGSSSSRTSSGAFSSRGSSPVPREAVGTNQTPRVAAAQVSERNRRPSQTSERNTNQQGSSERITRPQPKASKQQGGGKVRNYSPASLYPPPRPTEEDSSSRSRKAGERDRNRLRNRVPAQSRHTDFLGEHRAPPPGLEEEGEEDESEDTEEGEELPIRNLLQLPLRHKIPQHSVPRVQGTICNVDSMLVFPSASTDNYVTFTKGFSTSIYELSICTWLKVGSRYLGTLFSYATQDSDNMLVLYGRNTSSPAGSVDLVIGDPAHRELPVHAILDDRWHHLCVVWSSIEGRFQYYIDRRLTATGSRFQNGYEIPPGGVLILGQEQDSVGGGFDPAEAFVGKLAGFTMWPRVLSPGEISWVATGKGTPRGAALSLDDVDMLRGAVRRVPCDCLEHCT
ncbi:pentraxin-4 [Engraulis encrasicolus]|uniref:pentraxin-4 n=1 Tax=Engraulis encrasicolus TaxID=184585 RepID=UPI002FCF4977